MSGSRKVLMMGGLSLVLWGMGYGLLYAILAEHQTLDQMGNQVATGFANAAERKMPQALAALDAYAETKFGYVRQVDVHSHWIGLGMLLVVLGVVFDRVTFDEPKRLALAAMLVFGSAVFPLGVVLEIFSRGLVPKLAAAIGSGLIIVALGGVAIGFALERWRVNGQ